MEPVIALHAPAAASVAAATAASVTAATAASSSAGQPPSFPPGATFAVVASAASPRTAGEDSSQHPAVTRIMSPSYPDNLKFLQIASSTDSTCSAAVSTPESKSSDCPPSPKQVDFDPTVCSPPQSSSSSEGHGSYIDVHRSGGEGTDGEETAEENLLPAQVKEDEIRTSSSIQQRHPDSPAARFISVAPPLDASSADSHAAPVAALLAAAATAVAPLRTEPLTRAEATVAEAIKAQALHLAEPAVPAATTPAEEAGGPTSAAVEAAELPGPLEVDVAIIGAGLAGLTAALAIHKKTGRAVHVFEKEIWRGEEPPSLRGDTEGWKAKLMAGKTSAATAGKCFPAAVGSAEAVEEKSGHPDKDAALLTSDSAEVTGAGREADDREILLQANGLDALRCIDEQLACDVLESGHIVYSDSLDIFDWEAKATTTTTLVFGIYWSDLRQILYRHCQRYKDDIIFVFGKELKVAVDDSCMPSTTDSASAAAMVSSAASPSFPPTVSTSLSSPLSSSTISTPSSCSAYSSSLSSTPVGGTSTQFNHTKNPTGRREQRDDQYVDAALSHTVATGQGKGEKMQSFCATVSDNSVPSTNGVKLRFHDGTQVSAKLVVGADGPESCARKTCAMKLAVPSQLEETNHESSLRDSECQRGGLSAPRPGVSDVAPSSLQSAKVQYQGLTELAVGEDEVSHDMCLYHKKSGHHISMIRALGPNVLTWSLTRHMNHASAETEVAPDQAPPEDNDWKGYVLKTVAHMKEDTSEKTSRAFELLHRLIERTSQEDVQCFSLSRPAYQDCRWTRLNDRLVLVGNAAHPTPPNIGQSHDLTIEDTVQLAFCLRDWNANDVWATQRFASIRKQSLSSVVKLSEAVYKAIWSNEELRKHSDGELQEMHMGAESSPLLFPRANFVPVRSFFGADESQALLENAELETEYM